MRESDKGTLTRIKVTSDNYTHLLLQSIKTITRGRKEAPDYLFYIARQPQQPQSQQPRTSLIPSTSKLHIDERDYTSTTTTANIDNDYNASIVSTTTTTTTTTAAMATTAATTTTTTTTTPREKVPRSRLVSKIYRCYFQIVLRNLCSHDLRRSSGSTIPVHLMRLSRFC